MSLPSGFLDELRGRLSMAEVAGRKVMWDQKKSNRGKGDWWAPCPFHQEKTASFHVDDRKGYYYCFGCQAKGDMIGFVMETENVAFMEAVEILAREAGLQMPARDPQAQKQADRRTKLTEVMDEAARWFRLQLRTAAAADARAYLAKRGLDEAAQERWQIGYAPPGWEGLRTALTGKGVELQMLLDTGLVKPSDKGRQPYDTFRGRIMFPIRDPRGRTIAFGGRALDPNESAKYLNSPETVLFDKGRTLYNHGPAREAAGKGAPLLVAEGYMDVIALAEAGFPATVAALGTAVTEQHLTHLWRIADEPIIALDGDAAGLRAALRVIDIALPMLAAGKSLRFAMMPEGMDPDDLIRARGAAAVTEVLERAEPMVRLLWRRETDGKRFDSPERKAALDRALGEATARIADQGIRRHYDEAFRQLKWELFRPPRRAPSGGPGGFRRKGAPEPVRDTTRSSLLAATDGAEDHLCEAAILATLISTPAVIPDFEGAIERMDCAAPGHGAIRDAVLALGPVPDLRARLAERLGAEPLEKLFGEGHVAIAPAVRRPGDEDVARLALAGDLAKLAARRGRAREVAEAAEDLTGVADEGLTWRLAEAARAVERAGRGGEDEDRSEFRTGPNGARMKRQEIDAFAALLGQIDYGKGGRRS
ncbi:DNA primase [Wenxinia marina]|uniref:DNA primase n=1 Tax=Wenxinia marina DSM 24838 TaxID=1123501 RepID=A0A0D0QFB4_9RHOB|nr:DNA primase [Wenxinia marina]KIQ69673.1 DNA primase [Wenxinia marina DSM 24838]GGL60249.1 DNA primase [Wenxinia marina]